MTNIRHGFIPDKADTEVPIDPVIQDIIDDIKEQLQVSDNAIVFREACLEIIAKLGGKIEE